MTKPRVSVGLYWSPVMSGAVFYLSSEEAGVLQLGNIQLHMPALSIVSFAALQQDRLGVEAALAIARDPTHGVHRLLREIQLPSAANRWLSPTHRITDSHTRG